MLQECHALEAQITARGFLRPEVSVMVNFFSGRDPFVVRVDMRTTDSYDSAIGEYFDVPTVDDLPLAFDRAREWIAQQKDPKTLLREQFIQKLGRLIDEGRNLDLPVDFMNPLEQSMRDLSTNILEVSK